MRTQILTPRATVGAASAVLDVDAIERRVETVARLLDSAVRVPGTRIRFGADSVVGLIPGIGDLVSVGVSTYLLYEAHRLGAPDRIKNRMAANIAVDAVIGSVPLVGDVFDVFFKANMRNLALLREHIATLRADRARPVTARVTEVSR
jgi:hypothetical protein